MIAHPTRRPPRHVLPPRAASGGTARRSARAGVA